MRELRLLVWVVLTDGWLVMGADDGTDDLVIAAYESDVGWSDLEGLAC